MDDLRDEEEKKDLERIKKEEEADKKIHQDIKTHITNKEQEPFGDMTDYNFEKQEIVDKIGEIFFNSMKDGNEEPKKEILSLIDKYSNYLKSLSNSDIDELIKTGKVKKLELPKLELPEGDFLQKGIVQRVKTKKEETADKNKGIIRKFIDNIRK